MQGKFTRRIVVPDDMIGPMASGTLAELLGPSALPGDAELRTIGIRTTAERLPFVSAIAVEMLGVRGSL